MKKPVFTGAGVAIIAPMYEDCVAAIASNIDALLEQPERFSQLAHGTVECARKFTWAKREEFLNKLYDDLLRRKQEGNAPES